MEPLATINVPTLLVTGDEDTLTGVGEAEAMQRRIARSTLKVIPRSGHYAVFEQHEEAARMIRKFVESLH